jgi:hypothetical protein
MLKVFQGRLLKKAMQTYERSTMVDNGLNPHGLRHVKINKRNRLFIRWLYRVIEYFCSSFGTYHLIMLWPMPMGAGSTPRKRLEIIISSSGTYKNV